mmetsp:Transcript_19816/g.36012  ORF Transcript_19816/g.36012 Transcript_19816/m.36012 type:complete len:204 (-) Transcript_19816:211-822(-)
MRRQEVLRHIIGIKLIFPSTRLEGFNQSRHVGILFRRHVFKPRLMNNARHNACRITRIQGRKHSPFLRHSLFFHGHFAQRFAIAGTLFFTSIARGSRLFAKAIAAGKICRQTIILHQNIKKIGSQGRFLGFGQDLFLNGGNKGNFIMIEMARFGIVGSRQFVQWRQDLKGQQGMSRHEDNVMGFWICNMTTISTLNRTMIRES